MIIIMSISYTFDAKSGDHYHRVKTRNPGYAAYLPILIYLVHFGGKMGVSAKWSIYSVQGLKTQTKSWATFVNQLLPQN